MTATRSDPQASDVNVSESTAQAEGIGARSSSSAAATPKLMDRAYERILGFPAWVVVAVMWVAGTTLLVSCVLALYMVGSLLVGAIAGSSM